MFHNEVDGAAAFSAAETLADAFRSGNAERGRFFVVKRAEPHIVGASTPQMHEVGYDVDNVCGV